MPARERDLLRFRLETPPGFESVEERRDDGADEVRCAGRALVEGRTSFFCLEAGRISSRSTGTPRDTRKRRRMRERFQSGGWSGGEATS